MGASGARNLRVWAALPMAALVVLVGVLLAKPAQAKAFTVNSTNHPGSGVCDATECALKEAVNEANTNAEGDTIGFASGLGGEIELSNSSAEAGGFFIRNDTPAVDVRIVGPRGGLTIDGNGQAQVFVIQAPTSATSGAANATIERLTIKNGLAPSSPATPGIGGGIYNGGTLALTNSTVSGNNAGAAGGGILNAGTGTLTLTNSTVSGNSANNAGATGGGIRNDGDATLVNTIVAGNSAPTGPDAQGAFISLGHNLIGDTTGSSGWVDSDLKPVDPLLGPLDPLLGPLQNNGGTASTHALLPGSPAIDSGTNTGCPAADQRGVARPNDGDKNGTAICDIGSLEQAPPNAAPVAGANSYSVREDAILRVRPRGVLANDFDANADRLTARKVTSTRHGTLALRADGSLVYNSKKNFNGVDTFFYRAFDGKALSNQAKVTIRVRAVAG